MPYITKDRRTDILLADSPLASAGELNFMISLLVDKYISEQGLSYTKLNEVIGVLECVKQEIYRRIAAPYEDKKIEENGEVFREEHLG